MLYDATFDLAFWFNIFHVISQYIYTLQSIVISQSMYTKTVNFLFFFLFYLKFIFFLIS